MDEVKKIPFIRYSFGFNLTQTTLAPESSDEGILECDSLLKRLNFVPEIKHNFRDCYYSPKDDYISIPRINDFSSSEEYYSSLFHELIHSTGHSLRLNRLTSSKDKAVYAKEELIAEIGSAYLCAMTGIQNKVLDNQAAYIDGWLKAIQEDKSLIISAAIKAKQAVDYLSFGLKF